MAAERMVKIVTETISSMSVNPVCFVRVSVSFIFPPCCQDLSAKGANCRPAGGRRE